MNKIVLTGRLTRDPEERVTTSGLTIAKFSVAVDRRSKDQNGEKQTDFFNCSAFRSNAEFVNNYAKKGRLVAVEGRVEINNFTKQDGSKGTAVDVICDNVELLDKKPDADAPPATDVPVDPAGSEDDPL
jgi:single-strand DNA-binding protein